MNRPVHEYVEVGLNWFIQRRADGSVSLLQKAEARLTSKTVSKFVATADEWTKMVAAVSLRGLGEDTLVAAEALHGTEGVDGTHADPSRIVYDSMTGEAEAKPEVVEDEADTVDEAEESDGTGTEGDAFNEGDDYEDEDEDE